MTFTRKFVEIGALVFDKVRIVVEVNGHGGKRFGAYKFATLVERMLAALVPALDGHRELSTLYLFPVYWQAHVVAAEKRNYI